ncbi:inorganic phosphate transporter [Actinomyces ruminicola]|nr:inorganic phosphate transporter [Actinomyces ruminicola]SDM60301.1 Phosphate transporter family protein [Actinomyces ruminicola]
MLLTAALVLAFTAVVGRNDGAPLCSLSIGATRKRPWRLIALLTAATVTVPLVGITPVADTYRQLLGGGGARELGVVLLAAIVTLAAAAVVRVPTSVTLALVGAATGTRLAGGDADWPLVIRVLVLAALAPLLAGLCARALLAVLERIRLPHADRWVGCARSGGFICVCAAYACNDGQKLFVVWTTAFAGSLGGPEGVVALRCVVALGSGLAFAAGT